MPKKKSEELWPDRDNLCLNTNELDDGARYTTDQLCKALRMHAEVMERCADKICKALWAGVKKDNAVSGD